MTNARSTAPLMTAPKLDTRAEQHYLGIRTQVTMRKFRKVIPESLGEIFGWLRKRGVTPVGAPFIRYHVINMEKLMDIELGVPVSTALAGDDRVKPGVLPAGRYASLIYTDVKRGVPANAALLEWGAKEGLRWDNFPTATGDGFGGRYESFLTDPDDEPDPAKWETEVAIRLADD